MNNIFSQFMSEFSTKMAMSKSQHCPPNDKLTKNPKTSEHPNKLPEQCSKSHKKNAFIQLFLISVFDTEQNYHKDVKIS